MGVREELENYNTYKADVKRLERDIAKLEAEEVSPSTSNYSVNGDIRPKGYVECGVANKVIDNRDKIAELKATKEVKEKQIAYLDSLINILDDDYRRIVELRYKYNKMPVQIGTIIYKGKRAVNKALKKAITILEEQYLKEFPVSA